MCRIENRGSKWSGLGLTDLLSPRGYSVWPDERGRLVTHRIYMLPGCPAPSAASWVLVRRNEHGGAEMLARGAADQVASLNLARIRQLGATLGADEVHVAMQADGDHTTSAAERGLGVHAPS